MSDVFISYGLTVLTPILVGLIGWGALKFIAWMRTNKNTTIHAFGELVYKEVQDNFVGVAGEAKLKIAIQKMHARFAGTSWANSISDDVIVQALEKAWFNQEGQYKSTTPVPVDVTPTIVVPQQLDLQMSLSQGSGAVDTLQSTVASLLTAENENK
jgi:hypothetical protein